jgi:hypothetical protein
MERCFEWLHLNVPTAHLFNKKDVWAISYAGVKSDISLGLLGFPFLKILFPRQSTIQK